ncbi:hypothetical protein JQ633_34390, partial [Bradyrhizobium tropiciagri]|uniref:calcium-binding protein n=1 Tax=Bradyrhizobium tropiciagri TaxID=312253 RepID=UPI001BA75610
MATITVHAGGSIQAAIDSANNGDTIFIENGVYNEQVSIAGRVGLTLQGESEAGVVITSPASIVQNAVDATTGRLQDALIAVSNSSNITIENVKIDGADRGNTIGGGGSGNDFVGIAVANSTGQIDHVDVTGIRDPLSPDGELSGVQHGNAIVITNAVGSPLAFTVSNSSIENYQKTAIIARNTIATLTNNDIDGGGPHNVIAQNGIQLSSGSTGTVTGNHISGIGFTPDSNDVVGVLVFDSHGSLNISGNTFDGTTANDVFAYLVNTSGATVTANTINHTETGVVDSGTVNTPNSVGGNTFSDVDTAYSFDPDPTSTPYNVTGTEGNDILHGGAGNDHIDGLGGIDTIDMTAAGAAGSIVNLTSGLAVSTATGIDTLANVENVLGSAGNDTLIGDANDNTFFATAGTDNIDGRGGNDTYDASSASASVLIDLDGGYAAGGLNGNLTSIENAIGGSGDDFIAGGVGANILSGNAGSDTFFNLHNGDVVHGGSGVDTAVFTANVSAATFATGANHVLNVTVGGETVALDSVEKLQFNDHNVLVVGAGGQYATIQAAINASHSGDTIIVTAGVYQENLNVNVSGLTIEAAGAVTVQGTLKTDNGIPDGGLSAFLSNSSPTVNVSGNDGVIISADNVTLRGINVDGFYHAVKFGDGRTTAGATFDGVTISDSVFGYEKSISAGINGLNIIGGSISGGYVGIDFNQDVASAPNTNGATDVTIDGTLFSDLNRKGIYAETLSDAHITNITMSNVGQYGSGPLDGSLGTGGNGIDLNLKNGVYSDVEIDHFHLTNTGASDQADQAGHPVGDKNGGAIVVEARDQGSYASTPGTFTGSVNIHDGTIDGQTSTGIQAGEPGQNNAGPMVIVNNVDISGAEQNALHGSIANVTQSTMTVTGTAGADDIETSVTSTGAIEFHGGAGADTFVGHNELDTATYGVALTSANITYNTVNHQWVVDAGAEGVDHLSGVEKITDSAGHTFILAGNGYGTIQAAINAAHTGDTILVAAGDYNGNIDVNVAGVTIKAMGDVTIHGTFKSDNGIADGDVASFLQTAAAYTGAAGSGVTISANNVTIEGLHLDGFLNGVQFADNMNVSGATFNDVAISDSVFGYWKGSAAGVSGLTLNDGAISDSYIGVYFQKNTTVGQSAVGNADHVVIDGTSFTDITQKGIYAETLSDAHITNIAMDNVGQYGGGPAFGADGNAGNGINLNLKNGSYSNIEIDHFTLHDVGASDGVVSGGQANGGAIVVEARDQGSYAGTPGTFSGAVNIHDGSITGHTSTGIQAGEPTQTNAGPIVTVTNVTVDGASQNAIHGDITNETQSVMTLNGTAGADEVASSASSTGAIVFHGGGGADTFTGHGELDTATYNVTLTSADITYDQDAGQWVVNAGADGVDRLSGVEKITDGTHTFILAGNGYASIQAAVDAAGDGDTILIAAGTWAGDISVNDKQLTFLGINHGIDGAGDGRAAAESAILGKVQVFGDKNVTFDGIEFLADDNTGTTGSSSPALGFHGTGDYRVTNSVFYNETTGGATDARAISLDTSVSGAVTIDHNAFTGDAHGNFGDASWGRGIWSDGTSSHLDINNNSFEYVRSGINLDGYSDATHSVTDNVFVSAGTGISVGAPNGTTFTGIHDNDFQAVGDDFNFQNVTTPVTIDLTANPETSSGGDVGLGGGVLQILGGKADDHITGSAGADNIFGNNGNDVLKGGGGADLIVGGAGTDTAVYSTNITVDKLTAVADLGATLGNQSGWIVNAGANEGTDTLVGVEVVSSGTGHILLVGSGGFATIQDAVNAAGDGDIILIAAGTWAGDVSVNDKQLTFLGVNHGIDGAGDGRGATESAILGKVQVFGDKNVTFDGIEFLADDNTGTTGSSSPALGFHGTGDYRVTNSVFYNETTGGATDARAISLDTSVSGAVTIDHNAFTGDAHGNFGDASWGRGIWSDGTSSHLDINNNSFEYVRSGINLDSYDDASHSVTDNVFVSAGTGISVGAPNGTTFTGIHDNDFQAVGDDFNFQNVTTPVTIDLTTNPETSSGGDVGLGGGVLQILGGKADDHITGSAGADNIFGNNGNDVLKGGGGADLIVGGAGTDTAVYST